MLNTTFIYKNAEYIVTNYEEGSNFVEVKKINGTKRFYAFISKSGIEVLPMKGY